MSRLPLAIFLGIMLVCGGALVWLGHQVLEQDRTLEAHRAQERLEHAVDHVAATFARKLLELDSTARLEGVVEIRSGRNGIEPVPPARLLYLPAGSPRQGMPSGLPPGRRWNFSATMRRERPRCTGRFRAPPIAASRPGRSCVSAERCGRRRETRKRFGYMGNCHSWTQRRCWGFPRASPPPRDFARPWNLWVDALSFAGRRPGSTATL